MYLVKTPWWLRALYPSLTWRIKSDEKVLYVTFDDGPHETATPFVLDELKKYHAKATFFCIGKNVVAHRSIYERIIDEGHTVGNHTYHHLNGWKTGDETYIKDVQQAAKEIDSNLFRPPYGRITRFQAGLLSYRPSTIGHRPFSIIMWDVLSADFDARISSKKCLENVLYYSKPGSVIVFHDSAKAWEKMSYTLPKALEYFSNKGYRFQAIRV